MAAVPLGFTPSLGFVGPVDTAVGELTGKNLVAALREGLSNAFRHAGASRIDVVVDADVILPDGRPGVRLTVADDGVGIPEGGRRSGLQEPETARRVAGRRQPPRTRQRPGRRRYDGGVAGPVLRPPWGLLPGRLLGRSWQGVPQAYDLNRHSARFAVHDR